MNFDRITDNVYVGTTPENASDVAALQRAGVTHLIDCRDDLDDAPLLGASGIVYLWNGTPDWTLQAMFGKEPKPVSWFKASLDFWYGCRNDPANRLYVHCSAGVNRSATTAWMLLRSLQLSGPVCDWIIDSHRLISTFGTFADHPWRADAENALRQLGYIK